MTILLIISLPFLLALAALPRRLRSLAVALAPWAALPALGLAVWSPSHLVVELPWLFLGMRLGLDEMGRIFIIGTAVLWTLVALSTRASLALDSRRHRFFIAYLVTLTGILGLFLAQDLLAFTLFYALITFAVYGLIIYEDNPVAQRAGQIYLILAVIGEALLLETVLLISAAAGNHDIAGVPGVVVTAPTRNLIMVLLLAGFGIKIGVFPFHVWMPLAYSSVYTGASGVLVGSIVMAGFFGCIRLLPLGEISLLGWDTFFITTGTVALLYGVLVGMTQTNPRTILAYSSISQVGLMITGLGLCMVIPEVLALTLGMLVLYILHHALVMGALFLGLTVAKMVTASVWQHRMVGFGFFLSALTLAGAPFTSGAVVKHMFHTSAAMTPWAEQLNWLLGLAAIGTALLMGRFLVEAWPQVQAKETQNGSRWSTEIWLPWSILILCGGISAWVLPWSPSFQSANHLWAPIAIWESLWPLLVGGILVWGVKKNPRLLVAMSIPPGDIIIWVEWLMHRVQEGWHGITGVGWERWGFSHPLLQKSRSWISSNFQEMELQLGQWMALGAAFLFLAALFLILLTPAI